MLKQLLNCSAIIVVASTLSGCAADPISIMANAMEPAPEAVWRQFDCDMLTGTRKLYVDYQREHPTDVSTMTEINVINNVMREKSCPAASASGLAAASAAPTGKLGVNMSELTPAITQAMKLSTPHGVLVIETFAGSGAERAGIKPMDVILEVSGQQLQHITELQAIVNKTRLGMVLPLRIWRGGTIMDVDVEVSLVPAANAKP